MTFLVTIFANYVEDLPAQTLFSHWPTRYKNQELANNCGTLIGNIVYAFFFIIIAWGGGVTNGTAVLVKRNE